VDGVVREITVTMTVILTEAEVVTVPNSKIWGGPIKNKTRRESYSAS
jgi:small-conductance mechanosensitive channel